MANHDLSRHLFRPANRYTGLRMQQGRPMLDSDFSEGEMLDDEDQRAVAVDVIGPHGSPDMGFHIQSPSTSVYDFSILSGSYYLGGMRHEIVGTTVSADATATAAGTSFTAPQRFRAQTDWLQATRRGQLPQPPSLPADARRDLAYLVGWEQEVSAVEDREFHEMALGGPDTTTRIWRGHRVYVHENVPEGCHDAFEKLVESLESGGNTFDRANHELKSGARLTVVIDEPGADDLCEPAIPPGYSGVENQAIRVQVIARFRLLWSYDNAAPLYRVRTSNDSNATVVEFLTQPRDQAHYPVAGQVFEILPFGAQLANDEYTADYPIAHNIGGGVLARVLDAYDPVRRTVKVQLESADALAAMTEWFGPNGVAPEKRCFYLRVWNPGDGSRTGPIGLGFKIDEEVALPGTGLRIKISKPGIVGDHWIIAARPSTPTEVVPWTLRSGEPPHGPRRFYAPLAMLHWTFSTAFGRGVTVDSCRRTFQPLTRRKGCCTVTVGDENKSFGDFTSITAALASIPVDQPAKICVLPGEYRERVVIHGRSHLVIEGCGATTLLATPTTSATTAGLIEISSSHDIVLKDLTIEAKGQFGVKIADLLVKDEPPPPQRRIRLEGLSIKTMGDTALPAPGLTNLWTPATGAAPFPMATIAALLVDDLRITGCVTTMVGDLSGAPNISLSFCTAVTIRGNRIQTVDNASAKRLAWGGLQIGALCERVLVEDNWIEGGSGHGITFGMGQAVADDQDELDVFDPVGRFALVAAGTLYNSKASLLVSAPPAGGGTPVEVGYHANCRDIRILRNTITGMGSSGISVLGFEKAGEVDDQYEAMTTHDVEIADNVIRGNCAYRFAGAPLSDYVEYAAVGGIVLGDADNLRIHGNTVLGNGPEETVYPICGIYLMHGENVAVENNRVTGNGKHGVDTATPGHRPGIGLMLTGRRATGGEGDDAVEGDALMPAARVRGNVVHHPMGKALQLYGIGPMFVEGNVFVAKARGIILAGDNTGRCVDIHNLGQSPELIDSGVIPGDLGFLAAPPLLWSSTDPVPVEPMLVDGRILFTGNQVRYSPEGIEMSAIHCVNRFQSYGDVAVLDNQFFVDFPSTTSGSLENDTIVAAWSTRTANNRWVDPATAEPYQTVASATTAARMNITALNQATRCIHVLTSATLPVIAGNPVDYNQTLTPCHEDEEEEEEDPTIPVAPP
ncbi:right-handed parallel beta-helix repeat-containing protein [Nannocystis sp. ILAH1]|uniref:right-handed parallel beta-helix repeat-containing protein n=1 Tax=Nannocystis sp. ILAH1 TaxID=2996789 RepID=UPI002270A040|nr:right-handed parallel beta-helix repeat-containing protein [Nannocystis sp. ILAH1]MCY0990907.1 right-handed parallel beta-helix repeat-containing protein [Nannocystis sp. ILAH1]